MALTRKQKDVLDFITEYVRENGVSPTQKEIQENFQFKSLGSVQDYIKYLKDGGYLSSDTHSVRGLMPSAVQQNTEEIPLLGSIAAGTPIEAIENTDMIAVPTHMLGRGKYYALKVKGESMIEAGILDGDYALIRRTDTARDGEIVVALVRGEEATLKYLRREDGRVRLDPANAAYEPQLYDPREVVVQGKLAGLLRRYH